MKNIKIIFYILGVKNNFSISTNVVKRYVFDAVDENIINITKDEILSDLLRF